MKRRKIVLNIKVEMGPTNLRDSGAPHAARNFFFSDRLGRWWARDIPNISIYSFCKEIDISSGASSELSVTAKFSHYIFFSLHLNSL